MILELAYTVLVIGLFWWDHRSIRRLRARVAELEAENRQLTRAVLYLGGDVAAAIGGRIGKPRGVYDVGATRPRPGAGS